MNKHIKRLLHGWGFGCVISAIFLELWVFYDIFTKGYFRGGESNIMILMVELHFPVVALIYFIYLIISARKLLDTK